jgi:hypothetical protein
MKSLIVALTLIAGLVTPALSAPWGHSGKASDPQAQKGRQAREQGGPPGAPPMPPQRQTQGDPRRDQQMNEDERRALHRDLDKANRELYRRR